MRESRLALLLLLPALAILLLVTVFPLLWTVWESLRHHALGAPGVSFAGLGNYAEALGSPRVLAAWLHTAVFTGLSVALEFGLALLLALSLRRAGRAAGLLRTGVLLPWAVPTVVAALLWRFIFESPFGLVNTLLLKTGLVAEPVSWLADPAGAWVPLILGDVWRMTPFVTLLLLAGLNNIPEELYEAARIDGAGSWGRFRHVTLPLLRPAMVVALVFRILDALRVFDLVYVLTGGGPGTATEPVSLHAQTELVQNLRIGYGSALCVLILLAALLAALGVIRGLGRGVFAAAEGGEG